MNSSISLLRLSSECLAVSIGLKRYTNIMFTLLINKFHQFVNSQSDPPPFEHGSPPVGSRGGVPVEGLGSPPEAEHFLLKLHANFTHIWRLFTRYITYITVCIYICAFVNSFCYY